MIQDQKRVVALMPVDLIDQIDNYAAQLHINRTAAVNVLVSRALQFEDMFRSMPKLLAALDELERQGGNND